MSPVMAERWSDCGAENRMPCTMRCSQPGESLVRGKHKRGHAESCDKRPIPSVRHGTYQFVGCCAALQRRLGRAFRTCKCIPDCWLKRNLNGKPSGLPRALAGAVGRSGRPVRSAEVIRRDLFASYPNRLTEGLGGDRPARASAVFVSIMPQFGSHDGASARPCGNQVVLDRGTDGIRHGTYRAFIGWRHFVARQDCADPGHMRVGIGNGGVDCGLQSSPSDAMACFVERGHRRIIR